MYLQPLVYISMWLPGVVKSEWELRAPDDERYAARNMLGLQ